MAGDVVSGVGVWGGCLGWLSVFIEGLPVLSWPSSTLENSGVWRTLAPKSS